MIGRGLVAGFGIAIVLAASAASAQQTVRVRGQIEATEGDLLTIKPRDGAVMMVRLTENAGVFGVTKATLADVKPGAFIGVGAMPQPDGSQKAIQVTIFAESQRGTGEGHRPWDRPNSTMTNATVDTTAVGVEGQKLTVKYKGGEQVIVVPPEATIRSYAVGEKSELKVGAEIAINAAVKKPDGTLEASRINVSRDGTAP